MKKDRSKQILKKDDYEKFQYHDTRFFGLFYKKEKVGFDSIIKDIKIDMKRFRNTCQFNFTDNQLRIINSRQTHYFYPKKNEYYDYMCNIFNAKLDQLSDYWENHYKDLIRYAEKRIKRPIEATPGNNELLSMGIINYDEAIDMARWNNSSNEYKYKRECAEVVSSLYAQYVHQMASQIEAVTVYILSQKNVNVEHFNRSVLYGTGAGKTKMIQELHSFNYYDKLYCLWNFIKHNSKSTYEKLKESHPKLLVDGVEYKQGQPAYGIINFSDELILDLLNGCRAFFKEYCSLVFDEDYEEAQWNYGTYFLDIIKDCQDAILNPFGLPFYL